MAEPCIFNDLGFPNCVDSPLGPVFAPCHRFGYRQQWNGSDTDEPAKGMATQRARSFDCDDGLRYLRLIHTLGKTLPPMPVDIGETQVPDSIQWPERAGDVFKSGRKLNMDGGFVVDNMTLLEALQAIAQKAGRFDVYMKPLGNYRAQLTFLDMNPGPYALTDLHLQDYGPYSIAECLQNPSIVKEGFALENFKKYYHNTRIIGDPPSVELMLSMFAGLHQDGFEWGLVPAWSIADEQAFKNYVTSGGGNVDFADTPEAFNVACDIWPWVYAAYRVNPERGIFNPWIGTKWEGMVPTGRIRFKPFLNTWLQGNNQNPRNCQPREIPVDAFYPNAAPPVWQRASLFDNLTLSPDRTVVIFSGLRASAETWYVDDPKGNGKFGINLHMKPIRFTAALEAHWVTVGASDADPNNTAGRVKQQKVFSYQLRAGKGDYDELLRRGDSRPIGQANVGTLWKNWQARCAAGQELFSDRPGNAKNPDPNGRMMRHAELRCMDKRLVEPNAALRICRIAPGYHPGMGVSLKGAKTIPFQGVIKSVKFSMLGTSMQDSRDKAPDTWLEIGPPEIPIFGGNVQNGQAVEQGPEGPGYNGPGGRKDDYDKPHQDQPTDSGGNGGPGNMPMDDYEKAEAAKNAGGKPAAAAPGANDARQENGPDKSTPKRSEDAGERKTAALSAKAAKANNRIANMQDEYNQTSDPKKRHELERKMRQEGQKAENATRRASDSKASGGPVNHDLGWGTPNSGSINGRDSSKFQVGEAFGKAGSGRMTVQDRELGKDGKPTGRGVARDVGFGDQARNLVDTGKADAFSEKEFADRKAKENAGQQKTNDAADKRAGRDPLIDKLRGGSELARAKAAMPAEGARVMGPQQPHWWNKLKGNNPTPPKVPQQQPPPPGPAVQKEKIPDDE